MIVNGLNEERKDAALFCKKCGGKLLLVSVEEKSADGMKVEKSTHKCSKCGEVTKRKKYSNLK